MIRSLLLCICSCSRNLASLLLLWPCIVSKWLFVWSSVVSIGAKKLLQFHGSFKKWMGKRSFLLQNASPLWSANSSCVLLSRLVFHGERDIEIVEIINVSCLSMYFRNNLCEKKRLMTHSFERYRVLWDPMFFYTKLCICVSPM